MDKININCPECTQKFSVADSYIGKTVECGACEHKFVVSDSIIMKKAKHYPGDNDNDLAVYKKAPLPSSHSSEVNFETAEYKNVKPEYFQPASPFKVMLIALGVVAIVIILLLFIIGGKKDGLLQSVNDTNRFVLAGFIAITGAGLIIFGFRNKIKGMLLSLGLGGCLVAMPIIFPQVKETGFRDNPSKDADLENNLEKNAENYIDDSLQKKIETYKDQIGFSVIENSRANLKQPDQLKALILRKSKVQFTDVIVNYLTRELELQQTPIIYTSGREINGKPVILMSLISNASHEDVRKATARFGQPQPMNEILTELKAIEVIVYPGVLKGQPIESTNDPDHPDFFNSNYLELKNISRDRRMLAVKALQNITKFRRRADIVRALVKLINPKDPELSSEAIATLNLWTLPEYNTDRLVVDFTKSVVSTKYMTQGIMEYLVDHPTEGGVEILSQQWAKSKNFLLWENCLIRSKAQGEDAVIMALPTLNSTHYKSAANILSKVGTKKSLAHINNLLSKISVDDQKYFKDAIDEIKSRQ